MIRTVAIALIWSCALGLAAQPVTLVENGQARSAIVLTEAPTKAAQLAAYELQAHIALITSVTVPIVHQAPTDALPIYVGNGIDTNAFADQEYLLQVTPAAIILAGKDAADTGAVSYRRKVGEHQVYDVSTWPGFWDRKATLWAVYDFLERECGIRWLSPTEVGTDYQPRTTLTVDPVELRRHPSFPTRNVLTYVHSQWYDRFTSLWHAKSEGFAAYEQAAYPAMHQQFPNPNHYENYAKRGAHRSFLYRKRVGGDFFSANHSLYGYYDRFWKKNPNNPTVFSGEHPDWFSQVMDSQGRPAQPCYTNPAVQQQIIDDALNWFGGHPLNPNNGLPLADRNDFWGDKRFAIVPMDNGGYCQCAECQARMHPRPAPYTFANNMASDLVWPVINETAKAVGQAYPGKRVAALAYAQYAAYPQGLELAGNIDVQVCLGIRNPYARTSWEHEHQLLAEWAAHDQPLYAWLYYCFPIEMANRGDKPDWHVFPGFFAHTIASEFKLYHDSGVRGFFMNGFGQDVEAYVSFALMDDVTQDVDELLDDYFTRSYGPAAAPLRRLYETIERIYCDPASYPPGFNGHQYEIIAWGWLGTQERMAQLTTLMDEARQAITTAPPIQQQRFHLFDLAVWQYLVQGKARYEQRMAGWFDVPHLASPYVRADVPAHDPQRVDWRDAMPMVRWTSPYCEGSTRQISGRLTHDDECLYLRLTEAGVAPTSQDYWEVMTAANTPDSAVQRLRLDLASSGSVVSGDSWDVYAAIPLDQVIPGGVRPGQGFLLNVARRKPGDADQPIWVPTFGGDEVTARYGRITLDPEPPEETSVGPAGLIARWQFEGEGDTVKDTSGHGHDGTLHGTLSRCDSPFGRAILFPPNTDAAWIEVEGITELAGPVASTDTALDDLEQAVGLPDAEISNPPFTIEAWVWVEAPSCQPERPRYPIIFTAPGNANNFHIRPGYRLWMTATPEEGDAPYLFALHRAFLPSEWQHVAGVFDGQRFYAYVNGRLAGRSIAPITQPLKRAEGIMRLGLPLTNVRHLQFIGKLDEVSLYNRALTPQEIAGRYSQAPH